MNEVTPDNTARATPVAWPERMVNMPCPDGSTDRIVGFRIPEGHPALGKYGLSEAVQWLERVTVGAAATVAALEAEVRELRVIADAARAYREAENEVDTHETWNPRSKNFRLPVYTTRRETRSALDEALTGARAK